MKESSISIQPLSMMIILIIMTLLRREGSPLGVTEFFFRNQRNVEEISNYYTMEEKNLTFLIIDLSTPSSR